MLMNLITLSNFFQHLPGAYELSDESMGYSITKEAYGITKEAWPLRWGTYNTIKYHQYHQTVVVLLPGFAINW